MILQFRYATVYVLKKVQISQPDKTNGKTTVSPTKK